MSEGEGGKRERGKVRNVCHGVKEHRWAREDWGEKERKGEEVEPLVDYWEKGDEGDGGI